MMNELWNGLQGYLTVEKMLVVLRATVLLTAGFVVGGLLGRVVRRLAESRLELQQTLLLRRAIYYLVLVLFGIAALHQFGFDLSVLLGAAGVLSVAIGFASQTSASNLVSGLFLIAERPFAIGDVINVGGTIGYVLSIDLLAVKLRTFDNQFVRIPNETMIKTEVRTLTRFPIRRLDMQIGVAYREDLERVRKVLLDLADRYPLCLDEPKPLVMFQRFGESDVQMQFSVWGLRENYTALKDYMHIEVKRVFDAEGIEIPFPHRTLYSGSETEPLPVRMVEAT